MVMLVEIDTPHPRRLAMGHTGQRAADRRRNAACTTPDPTFHETFTWHVQLQSTLTLNNNTHFNVR